jgi:hypothetical protein
MSHCYVLPGTNQLLVNTSGVAPAATQLGQQVRSFLAQGSAIALSNAFPSTITSITLTPGIWDITAISCFSTTGGLTASTLQAGISTTTNAFTGTTLGDNQLASNVFPASGSDQPIIIPAYRVNVTTNTTYFMVGDAIFSAGNLSVYGRLSAIRVT